MARNAWHCIGVAKWRRDAQRLSCGENAAWRGEMRRHRASEMAARQAAALAAARRCASRRKWHRSAAQWRQMQQKYQKNGAPSGEGGIAKICLARRKARSASSMAAAAACRLVMENEAGKSAKYRRYEQAWRRQHAATNSTRVAIAARGVAKASKHQQAVNGAARGARRAQCRGGGAVASRSKRREAQYRHGGIET